jgi:secreted trypsin-like serine protease
MMLRQHSTALALLCGLVALPQASRAIVLGEAANDPSGLRSFTLKVESTRGELCTGVAIDRQSVLTAAHCVLGGGRFSVTSLAPDSRPRKHAVARILPHPSFVPGTTPRTQPGADLALIRLVQPLPQDITPLSPGWGMWSGEAITIAGFGLGAEADLSSARRLRSARLVSAGVYTSANSVTVAVDEARRGESAGAGACRGDSGGPALRGGAGSRELVGIVSWSSGPLRTAPGGRDRRVCGGFTSITPISDHAGWIAATAEAMAQGQTFAPRSAASPPSGREPNRAASPPGMVPAANATIIER